MRSPVRASFLSGKSGSVEMPPNFVERRFLPASETMKHG
jgi:hypothetical protein